MIVKESDIRSKIRHLLSEGDLTFYSPLGSEENFSIETPEVSGNKLDLSEDNSYDVIRLSKIVDAMTSHGSQNNIAWQTVAEGFLQNFGFSEPLGKQITFFDVTKGDTGYSVKSSFAKGKSTAESVFENAQLNFSTFFSSRILKNISEVSIIACYRRNNSNNTFSIVWEATPTLAKEILADKLKYELKDLKQDNKQLLLPLQSKLNESFNRATPGEIEYLFGKFEPFLEIIFKDFKNEDVESYKNKIKIMGVLRQASDDQIKLIFDFFREKGLITQE